VKFAVFAFVSGNTLYFCRFDGNSLLLLMIIKFGKGDAQDFDVTATLSLHQKINLMQSNSIFFNIQQML
jgi:hypothetical protein